MADRIPVIDLAPIISGDPGAKIQVAMELGSAAQTLGFAVVAGHGIDPIIGTELRDAALRFFDLPLEEKLVIRRPKNDQNRGYIPYGEETLVRMAGGSSPPDYKEVFAIGPDNIPDEPYFTGPGSYPSFAPNLWPVAPINLRSCMLAYWEKMEALMRTIAALQDADNGSITVGDIDVSKDKQSLREILGYLPQEFGVYPKISANDLLDHLAVMKGIIDSKQRKEVVESLLHQTNLWEAKDRKLGTFSGGMKQRCQVARTLCADPVVMLMDEPFAALDLFSIKMMQEIIVNLQTENNIGICLCDHLARDLLSCVDIAIVLSDCKIIAKGTPSEIIRDTSAKSAYFGDSFKFN